MYVSRFEAIRSINYGFKTAYIYGVLKYCSKVKLKIMLGYTINISSVIIIILNKTAWP